MSTTEKTKAVPEAEEEKGGGKKKLILLLLVVLLAAGGAAYFFLFSGGDAKAAAPKPGAVLSLEPVAVNLAGGGYLKVGIALQLTTDAGEEKLDGSKALDLMIATFSQAKPADVTGARDALKAALQQKIVKAYEGKVMAIYYTNYVTQ